MQALYAWQDSQSSVMELMMNACDQSQCSAQQPENCRLYSIWVEHNMPHPKSDMRHVMRAHRTRLRAEL